MRQFSRLIYFKCLIVIFICCKDFNKKSLDNPLLIKFEQSVWIDSGSRNGVLSTSIFKDTTIIIIGAYINCTGQFRGNIKLLNDTLNLTCEGIPKNNSLIELTSCNCYYKLKYSIKSLKNMPENIVINGESFEDNAKSSGIIELSDE